MQESVSMHKSPTPFRQSRMNQARSEEEEKERKRDRKNRGQEADGKKGSPTKEKRIRGTKTRPTYLGTGYSIYITFYDYCINLQALIQRKRGD